MSHHKKQCPINNYPKVGKRKMRVSLGKRELDEQPCVTNSHRVEKLKVGILFEEDDEFKDGDPNATSILACIGMEDASIAPKKLKLQEQQKVATKMPKAAHTSAISKPKLTPIDIHQVATAAAAPVQAKVQVSNANESNKPRKTNPPPSTSNLATTAAVNVVDPRPAANAIPSLPQITPSSSSTLHTTPLKQVRIAQPDAKPLNITNNHPDSKPSTGALPEANSVKKTAVATHQQPSFIAKAESQVSALSQAVPPRVSCLFSLKYDTFGSALNAFDNYLVQCNVCAKPPIELQTHKNDSSVMFLSSSVTHSITTTTSVFLVPKAKLFQFKTKYPSVRRFCFEEMLTKASQELPLQSPVINNLLLELFSAKAAILAFYTWLRRLSDSNHLATQVVAYVVNNDDASSRHADIENYLLKHGARYYDEDSQSKFELESQGFFAWNENPYHSMSIWRHERDRRIILPQQNPTSHFTKKRRTPLMSREGWFSPKTNACVAPLVIVGPKQKSLITWFIKQGCAIINYAQQFERMAQILLQPFSPNAHATSHDYTFSFDAVYRLARLIRRRIANQNDGGSAWLHTTGPKKVQLSRSVNILQTCWHNIRDNNALAEQHKAFVFVGVDCVLDADDLSKLQNEGAKILAFRKVPKDCSVDIDFLVQREYDLHAIFRNHF